MKPVPENETQPRLKNTAKLGAFVPFEEEPVEEHERKREVFLGLGKLMKTFPVWQNKKGFVPRNRFDKLNKELYDLFFYLAPTREETAYKEKVTRMLRAAAAKTWGKDATLETVGSVRTKTDLPTSNINITVLCDKAALEKGEAERFAETLAKSGTAETNLLHGGTVLQCILQDTGLSVEITFNNRAAIDEAEKIEEWTKKTPSFPELFIALKTFLKTRRANETASGGLGSYALAVMVKNFLSLHPKIQAREIAPKKNLCVLLVEFFELFGINLNTRDVVVTESGYEKRKEATQPRIAVMSPTDPELDLTKNTFLWHHIRSVFENAHYTLVDALVSNATERNPPETASILSAIIDDTDPLFS
ncbi:MAG: Poly(A) RNA polymerase [Amphiamblys sp. WSBS2006]|nr:MAG: Poly(A) RNA polymerase [Amphiamblys sp. WSBS2006]